MTFPDAANEIPLFMTEAKRPLGITDVVLRDAHQSLLATRMRIDDMLPIAEKLDQVGFWSLESWGGATFDACIRYLGEDPWERMRLLKQAMPNTPQQMLFRGQNILGYRHYADDLVEKFVERCAVNGVDVFRIFDALNDMRNLETAVKATLEVGKHAQGTISYTVSPVHTIDLWVDLGRQVEDTLGGGVPDHCNQQPIRSVDSNPDVACTVNHEVVAVDRGVEVAQGRLRARLEAWVRVAARDEPPPALREPLPAAVEEGLRALGYVE